MKLAFDAKRAFNNGTGLGNYSRLLLNALMRDFPEHEYLLFTPKMKDKFFHQIQGDYKLVIPEKKMHQAFYSYWRSYGVINQLLQNRTDIYHGLSNELPFNIHHTNIKTVVTIHDVIFRKHTEQYPWIDRQLYHAKTKYAVQHAHKVIAVSEETKRDLMELYNVPEEKIAVVYQSINPIFYDKTLQNNVVDIRTKHKLPKKYILNVGSFYPRKNQATLIQAFDTIKNEVEEDLVLVGSAGSLKQIQQLIADKNLEQRVHIINNISNGDMPALYQQASVFVFPSLFEGFGVPVLEALFSRTPVIATKGGAIEEAAGKNSLLVNPISVEEIADSILKVLKDEALRKQMIEAGYAHAMTMTDTAFAANTMAIYKSL